jgi:hypothetical protein
MRGRGFFVGVEFVSDRETKEPFDPAMQLANRIGRAAARDGLLCYPSMGNVDGIRGDTVILAPPYNATAGELEEITEIFGRAVRRGLEEVAT